MFVRIFRGIAQEKYENAVVEFERLAYFGDGTAREPFNESVVLSLSDYWPFRLSNKHREMNLRWCRNTRGF